MSGPCASASRKMAVRPEPQRRSPAPKRVHFRRTPYPADLEKIENILASTSLFYPIELETAKELIEEAIANGDESGYYFIFADMGQETLGYICYGPIPMVENRFDLYWIAVKESLRGQGIGGLLLKEAEKHMKKLACKYVYIETSARDDYAPTRRFYQKQGYREVARVPRFFGENDDKLIFMKAL